MSAFNKHLIVTLITLAGAVSAAQAQLAGGASSDFLISPAGDTLSVLANGGNTLSFSQSLLNALTVGGVNVTPIAGTPSSSGNTLTVTDLQVDLASKTIYASVLDKNDILRYVGTPYQGNPSSYRSQFPNSLPTTVIPFTPDTALTITPNWVTPGGASFESDLFKLLALSLPTVDTVIVPSPIPEPGTFALMGMGLLGLNLTTRRQCG